MKPKIILIKSLIKTLKNGVLSVLFPLHCVDCGTEGAWCCKDCLESLLRTAVLKCPVCGIDSVAGRTCERCRGKTCLDGLIAASSYADSGVRQLIKALKFDGALGTLPIIKRLSIHARGVVAAAILDALIVPVPLHKKRLKMRGYNQSEELGKEIFPHFPLLPDAIKKIKNTKPQTEQSNDERLKNVIGAFTASTKFNGEDIILIDDVYTTGATMNECAKVLKLAGAGEVWGFVIARG